LHHLLINGGSNFHPFGRLCESAQWVNMLGILTLRQMCETVRGRQPEESKCMSRRLLISVPVKAIVQTDQGVREFKGRLEELGEGNARICLDHPIAEGTELMVFIEFSDRRGREIQFRYEGKVVSPYYDSWYEVAVDFEEGVAISGAHAREILSELYPEED